MKTALENNTLTICLEGRIDTNNAQATEAELIAAVDANPRVEVVIDAAELEYISSAGLRSDEAAQKGGKDAAGTERFDGGLRNL